MSLKDINIDLAYRSDDNDMVKDFYNPVLSEAKIYKRAVGYFTVSSLINAAQGLSNMIENGGKVEIIASPKLSKEDIDTISLGYKMKDDVVLDALIREFNDIKSEKITERLNYIATLIADDRLDIKIALMDYYGAYHEKFGIVEDHYNNKILFTGSMNETENGQYVNFESFVVFKSWDSGVVEYINRFDNYFNELWENNTRRLEIKPFPVALKNKLLEYRKSDYVREKNSTVENDDGFDLNVIEKDYPKTPEWFQKNIREYQKEAVNSWISNKYRGLLSMATGTGKTLTGLYGLVQLYESRKKLVSVIVCPYQHLVEQWADDVKLFNINPVICYSKYDWRSTVYRKVKAFKSETIDNFTIITTNSTFSDKDMQKFLNEVCHDVLIIVDEAHNAGTYTMKNSLNTEYNYRLGLSATPKRFRDEENTKFIFEYFGGEVYSFDLQRAINEGYLTEYYYYPHIVHLTEYEQSEYNTLSLKIAQNIREENGRIIINDYAKNLLIKRSRLIAGASEKLNVLRKLMHGYQDKNYILVYCGATKVLDDDRGFETRQIEKVCRILQNEYGIKNRKFTAEESPEERKEIIEMFSDGQSLQAIVAIKCLDEGVNIPAIQHAFILSSNTDPKEFIQRRGRVLRLYKDKKYAYIHDFVTIPYNDGEKYEGSNLVETELKRVYEFNSLANNKDEGDSIIYSLLEEYSIDLNKIIDARDKYNMGDIYDEE